MRRIIAAVVLCCAGLVFFQCKQSTEPIRQSDSLSGITETGPQGPTDFIGALDLNDWDPSSYSHLTIRQDYWIDKAVADTISIMSGMGTSLKIHNLSQSILQGSVSVAQPFTCSSGNVSIQSGQTTTLNLSVDTNAVGSDTLILKPLNLTVGNNEQLRYNLIWLKPRKIGGVVVEIVPGKDRLAPAYPNPANGYFTLSFSISTDRFILLYILNDKFEPVDTLINSYKKAGSYTYSWLTTLEQRARFPAGLYRVVLQTETYSCSGDILLSK